MTNSTIKIAHIHVWDKKNKGDVGIVLAVQDLIKKTFSGNVVFTDYPIETLKTFDQAKVDELNAHDIVVVGGGGIFYHYFLPFDVELIEALTAPVVVFGVGYIREVGARSLKPEAAQSVARLCTKASLLGVRDYYTKNFLIKNGVDKTRINLIGDPAILLDETKPADFKLEGGIKIGLNLNYSGWLGFGRWQDDILGAYRQLADYFMKEHGATIYYLMHHPDEARIMPALGLSGMKLVDLNAYEQKHVYGQLDLVIGMMLHSCVMAFGAGTPEINVAYDLRNKSFARFINAPELVIPLEKLKTGALLETAKKLFAEQAEYRKKFARTKKRIEKKQAEFLNKLKRLPA